MRGFASSGIHRGPFWKFQISFWRHFLRTFSEDPKKRDSCVSASDLFKSRFWTELEPLRVIASSCCHLEPFWKFQICILSSEIGTFSKHQIWAFQLLKRLNLVFRACLVRWEGLQALESIGAHFENSKSHFGAIFSERFQRTPKSEILAFQLLICSNLAFGPN